MSHRRAPIREKSFEDEPAQKYTWIVYSIGMLLVGGLTGYVLSLGSAARPSPVAVVAPMTALPGGPATGVVDDVALKAYRDILARDPRNFQAAVNAGNMLYDARRYEEAIQYYQQAMAANGSDVNVSTDLGTALWYTGRADAALAQYAVSLSIDPKHAQTLFNLGIVRSDGKKDYAGAVQAWETLLSTSPNYSNAVTVRTMISEAKTKTGN